MCGICGIVARDGREPVDGDELAGLCAALEHRGPDGAGTFRDGPVGLGVRRLAVIDPENGDQPLRSEDGRIVVVCNGEIYNHRALRDELRARGHRFASGSDAEVLAHLYEEHGDDFVERLRGMFAIALWDGSRRRLLLARDPFGIKPLVYALNDRRLAFASELKALLGLPDVSREVDPEALEAYLAMNAVLSPRTMLRDVRRLAPGHLLALEADGRVAVRRWFLDGPVAARSVRREPVPALARELRGHLADAVAAHLVADRPVGVLLSGGVDSGIITALAAERLGPGLPTFTVGFDEPSFSELADARRVARRYGTDHHELVVTAADAGEHLRDVAWAFDEPRGDATGLPYWLAGRAAARSVTVVLSGEGGDELFGGYPTYLADRLHPAAVRAAAMVAPAAGALPSSSRRLTPGFRLARLARGAGLGPVERHHAWKEILSPDERAAVLHAGARGRLDPLDVYRSRYARSAGAEPIARLQDLDVGTFLADDLLSQTDRAGMAHGLEIRVPFLDPVVAGFARALPDRAKLRGMRTKHVLREAARPLLPAEIVRGPKHGFVAPAAAWLRGPLEPLARDILSPAALTRQGFLRPGPVAALLDRHVARREDLSRTLWALISFTVWADVHGVAAAVSPQTAADPVPT